MPVLLGAVPDCARREGWQAPDGSRFGEVARRPSSEYVPRKMASPYRKSANEPQTFVTRSVRALGWPFVMLAVLFVALGIPTIEQRNDEVTLECPPGDGACVVTTVFGSTFSVPEYSAVIVREGAQGKTGGTSSFFVGFGLYGEVGLNTRAEADRLVAAFRAHHVTKAEFREVIRVGKPLTPAFVLGGLGLAVMAVLLSWRGAYRFTRDDRRGVIRVERAHGLVRASVVEVPIAEIEEIIARREQREQAAFLERVLARYAVLFCMKGGHEVPAFTLRLSSRDAFAIAGEASALLEPEGPDFGAPP